MNNIKKTPIIIVLLALAGISDISANMLAPASYSLNSRTLLGISNVNPINDSMYLGNWKRMIANKINPSYFSQLSGLDSSIESFSNYQSGGHFNLNNSKYSGVVFTDNLFSSLLNDSLYFSFSSQSVQVTPFDMNQLFSNYIPSKNFKKTQSPIVSQEFYTPGYVLSKGGSSLAVSAVLVQQSYLDDSYGSVLFNNRSNSQLYNDNAYFDSTRGYGYRFQYSQALPAEIRSSIAYQSRIYMSKSDSFGYTYYEPGDFDIPSQYAFSLDVPLLKSNKIKLAAEMISYSQIDPLVHSGYSENFLVAYNSPVRSDFNLDDLIVYSVNFEQKISINTSFNIQALSRQQADATTKLYNKILKNDTAQFSYRVGFLQKTKIGNFNLSASFANKPILFGRSEFGRISKATTKHLEGVLSWSLQF